MKYQHQASFSFSFSLFFRCCLSFDSLHVVTVSVSLDSLLRDGGRFNTLVGSCMAHARAGIGVGSSVEVRLAGPVVRGSQLRPEAAAADAEQRSEVGQTGGDDTHSGLGTGPHDRRDLVVGDVRAGFGEFDHLDQADDIENQGSVDDVRNRLHE